jgi:hypothetical protein
MLQMLGYLQLLVEVIGSRLTYLGLPLLCHIFAICSNMHPRRRGTLMLGSPGQPIAAKPHRTKHETLEKILEHATKYIQHVTDFDPKGEQLHKVAIARHTARLKKKLGGGEDEELTVIPEAVAAVSRTRTNRPRIVGQPQDAQATVGTASEVILSVRAQVQLLTWSRTPWISV